MKKKMILNGNPIEIVGSRGPAGPDGNPIGTIISFMGISAPDDYLVCNGATHNISDYPSLANFFKTQFGTINHFGGDGTTTFAVPDLRNLFLRGYHGLSDEQLSGDIGEKQEATAVPNVYAGSDSIVIRSPKDSYSSPKNVDSSIKTSGGSRYASGNAWISDTANGTYQYTPRPVNTAVLYCIKAVDSKLAVIDTKDIYSLEEQVIGTWIDGKTLYQKVFISETGSTLGQYTTVGTIGANDVPVMLFGWIIDSYKNMVMISSSTDITFIAAVETKNISISIASANIYLNRPVYAIVRYTKTTDEEAT